MPLTMRGEGSNSGIHPEIAQLRSLARSELLDLWQSAYRRPAPQGLRRELLVPFLAYKIQENVYGGLKRSSRAELRRIARNLEIPERRRKVKTPIHFKAGTRLIRTWHGKPHEVTIIESGFVYRGTKYKSLSQIARNITGTQWSGPAFFGLRKSASSLPSQ